ncbi:phosphoribosylglycinamide formyltransferase [Eremomyces bilateralis CBS 781.70]|uniref:Phosphoribosylglycinamide formyltransferase n=1 Tax=Eremomyces bilateralis CBS 781.70 TaxID=1392243 RepID=A0A6G1GCU2_9PEZI|nr:phosphoribosylglycinamide formyltransferase [Eremomyces bilateralis CBS 781.70]KAF1815907.1 phosphoribosylglycinamide formyltransferase [Eremomyces bilateralis CBS 781.70]
MTDTNPSSIARITVLISGNGSNLQALIDAIRDGQIAGRIIRVISNRKAAYGLTRAANALIATEYHNLLLYKKKYAKLAETSNSEITADQAAREAYDADLTELILKDEPDLVVCAGFMHVLSMTFLEPMDKAGVPVINLHPALPGQFNGTDAIGRAHRDWLAGKISKTGVMVHFVIKEVDMGEPVEVEEIPFESGDEDLEKFEEKLHRVEWGVIVRGTRKAIEAVKKQKEQR